MKINGALPLVLVPVRVVRVRQRMRRMVALLGAAGVVALGVVGPAPLLVGWFAGLGATWLGLELVGRPCGGCGRWLRHTLMCPRGRP